MLWLDKFLAFLHGELETFEPLLSSSRDSCCCCNGLWSYNEVQHPHLWSCPIEIDDKLLRNLHMASLQSLEKLQTPCYSENLWSCWVFINKVHVWWLISEAMATFFGLLLCSHGDFIPSQPCLISDTCNFWKWQQPTWLGETALQNSVACKDEPDNDKILNWVMF